MVSIHAPAWGATLSDMAQGKVTTVSIHAPAWGATHLLPQTRGHRHTFQVGCDGIGHIFDGRRAGFNPRTRVGCDASSCR